MTEPRPEKSRDSRAETRLDVHDLRSALRRVGPGILGGGVDGDPSAVATFAIAGAQLGTQILWFAWISWPLMYAVQMMCSRLGLVTGRGVVGALRVHIPRPLLFLAAVALFVTNTMTIGADLSGMAEAVALVTHVRPSVFVVLFGIGLALATVKLHYQRFSRALSWLALGFFFYLVASFRSGPDWTRVLHDTFIFHLPSETAHWQIVVALIGTTFSPYFFVWRASQEVEEKRDIRGDDVALHGTRWSDLKQRKIDTTLTTFFSRTLLFFAVLASALTLHARGLRVDSAADAAMAIAPAVGVFSRWVYAIGLIGVGCLVIPVLAATAGYALSEVFDWNHGLTEQPHEARGFYGVILLSTAGGVAMQFTRISTVQALFWSGIVSGVLAPLLLIAVWVTVSDRNVMADKTSGPIERITVAVCIVAMLGATAMWLMR